jgi:hypothetical protein
MKTSRLYSMITSLVVALLTDSAFIIRWNHIKLFIKEPFHLTFHNFSREENEFNVDFKKETVHWIGYESFPSWASTRNMNGLIKSKISENTARMAYNSICAHFFAICSNPDYYDKLYYYGLVSRATIDRAYEITQNMSSYSNEVQGDEILKVPFEVGGNLLNKIWIPNDNLTSLIKKYIETEFNGYFVIGIQLRYEYLYDPIDTYQFINCSLELEKNLTNSLNNSQGEFKSKYKGVKWFVTSDSESILNRLIKEFPNKIIVNTAGKINHIVKGYDTSMPIDNFDAYARTIMDVELLSKCNEVILTGGSTYGFVAAMKMLKLPFYINGGHNNKCVKTGLSKPSLNRNGQGVFK